MKNNLDYQSIVNKEVRGYYSRPNPFDSIEHNRGNIGDTDILKDYLKAIVVVTVARYMAMKDPSGNCCGKNFDNDKFVKSPWHETCKREHSYIEGFLRIIDVKFGPKAPLLRESIYELEHNVETSVFDSLLAAKVDPVTALSRV